MKNTIIGILSASLFFCLLFIWYENTLPLPADSIGADSTSTLISECRGELEDNGYNVDVPEPFYVNPPVFTAVGTGSVIVATTTF